MVLSVEEAREKRVCRICEKSISSVIGPEGWPFGFNEMVFPIAITLNFGKEFAHTDCLKSKNFPGAESNDKKS